MKLVWASHSKNSWQHTRLPTTAIRQGNRNGASHRLSGSRASDAS